VSRAPELSQYVFQKRVPRRSDHHVVGDAHRLGLRQYDAAKLEQRQQRSSAADVQILVYASERVQDVVALRTHQYDSQRRRTPYHSIRPLNWVRIAIVGGQEGRVGLSDQLATRDIGPKFVFAGDSIENWARWQQLDIQFRVRLFALVAVRFPGWRQRVVDPRLMHYAGDPLICKREVAQDVRRLDEGAVQDAAVCP
jgi:hypothetical protein